MIPNPSDVGHRRRRPTLLLALVAALVPALVAAAEPPAAPGHEETQPFHRTLPFILRVNGQAARDARFYQSARGDSFLILSAALPGPVLLNLQSREVATLGAVPAERGDGAVVLPQAGGRKPQGPYQVVDSAPSFIVEGKRVGIEYPPPLVGLQKLAAIRAYNPEYDRLAAAYHPDAAALARLAAIKEPARLRIYFATWCSHCTSVLPNLMKVLASLPAAPFTVEYVGLPGEKEAAPELDRMKIHGIPTLIVYRRGQEVGRITGQEWQQPEVALRHLLAP